MFRGGLAVGVRQERCQVGPAQEGFPEEVRYGFGFYTELLPPDPNWFNLQTDGRGAVIP